MAKVAKPAQQDFKTMSYEQAFSELEEIVSQLEADSSSLEDALALFERGQLLSNRCSDLLDQAELRVRQLTNDDSNEQGD
jgi:exodeoxyribonuclease VII small subunit